MLIPQFLYSETVVKAHFSNIPDLLFKLDMVLHGDSNLTKFLEVSI